MSKSVLACSIERSESALVRLKSCGSGSYTLSVCRTLPFGSEDLSSEKGVRQLNKLARHLDEWPGEDLALSIGPENYNSLPAYFPAGATPEAVREYCRIEAGYFLKRPDDYHCDVTACTDEGREEMLEKQLLLFYPAAPFNQASNRLCMGHSVIFRGTPQLPILHLSKISGESQAILEIEKSYVLFASATNGRIEKFSCHPVKNRTECEYFAIRALIDNPVGIEGEVQVTGSGAKRSVIARISKESGLKLKPLALPESIPLSNPGKFKISSQSALKAISTALMALG